MWMKGLDQQLKCWFRIENRKNCICSIREDGEELHCPGMLHLDLVWQTGRPTGFKRSPKGEAVGHQTLCLMPVKPESKLPLKHTQVTGSHPEPGQIIFILLHYIFLGNSETYLGTLEDPATVSRPHLKAVWYVVMGRLGTVIKKARLLRTGWMLLYCHSKCCQTPDDQI